ncbi:Tat pathway signal protein [Salinarchaeum chitinilyticum]
MSRDRFDAIPRRQLVRSAVAIGGASALSACLNVESGASNAPGNSTNATDSDPSPEDQNYPKGPEDLSTLPERQHAWNAYLRRAPSGNTSLPEQQLVLFYEYTGSVPPTTAERAAVEDTFKSIERAYQRGTGGDTGATWARGLLFMLGYAPTYFDRFDESLPADVDLQRPADVIDRLGEDEATPEEADVAILLNSDFGGIPLSVEEVLNGNLDAINGVTVEGDFASVFEQIGRRPAVVGRGNPAAELDHPKIREESPLSMGFKSGFDDSNAPEDAVTFEDGPFAGGTTQLVSRLGIDLDSWYELDDQAQVTQMFGTSYDEEQVGDTAEDLGAHSGITEENTENLDEKAEAHGRLGHTQKTARARDDSFVPKILRRSEGNVSDPEHDAGMNFTSVQHGIEEFVATREAMNDLGSDDIDAHHSGIVDFLTVERRGTYLIPPRSKRALPSPQPDGE